MIDIEFRDWINSKILDYLPSNRQKIGDKILCRCPICGDSKKNSMKKRGYYYLNTATYHCFNCGETMNAFGLIERLSGSNFADIKKEYMNMMYDGKHFKSVSSLNGLEKQKSNNLFSFKNVIKDEWKNKLSDTASEYLANRKVLEAPYLKEDLYSYFSKKGDEYILIPWKINGIDAYFQLNDFEKHNKTGMKYIFPKNKDKLLYGLDNIDLSFPYIIVTEGVYDSLFIPNCIACGGRFLTDIQYDIIRKRYPKMNICISFDNDKPGMDSMVKSLKDTRFSFKYFKWFGDDTKEKDINDYVIKQNNVDIFKNKDYVESCIVDPLIMKMWMIKKGYVK